MLPLAGWLLGCLAAWLPGCLAAWLLGCRAAAAAPAAAAAVCKYLLTRASATKPWLTKHYLPVFARQGLGHQTMAGEALFVRICLDLLEFAAIYWNLLGFAGICWDLLGFAGICWDLLAFASRGVGHQSMAGEALFA